MYLWADQTAGMVLGSAVLMQRKTQPVDNVKGISLLLREENSFIHARVSL